MGNESKNDKALLGFRLKTATMAAKRLPDSREKSMLLTKLDEARLWLSVVDDE